MTTETAVLAMIPGTSIPVPAAEHATERLGFYARQAMNVGHFMDGLTLVTAATLIEGLIEGKRPADLYEQGGTPEMVGDLVDKLADLSEFASSFIEAQPEKADVLADLALTTLGGALMIREAFLPEHEETEEESQ